MAEKSTNRLHTWMVPESEKMEANEKTKQLTYAEQQKRKSVDDELDEVINWLIDNDFDHPEWDAKVCRMRELEHKYRVLHENVTDKGGIREVSIPRRVPTSQNYK